MSTDDVPGVNPANGDELRAKAWAEADSDDDSLIYVLGTEGGDVSYFVFDTSAEPTMMWMDIMPEARFKRNFTKSGWVWHDKTPFPARRVIREGTGLRRPFTSAEGQLTAAARLAERLELRTQALDERRWRAMAEGQERRAEAREAPSALDLILGRLRRALGGLRDAPPAGPGTPEDGGHHARQPDPDEPPPRPRRPKG